MTYGWSQTLIRMKKYTFAMKVIPNERIFESCAVSSSREYIHKVLEKQFIYSIEHHYPRLLFVAMIFQCSTHGREVDWVVLHGLGINEIL